jgi:tubulin-specific chaperone A
MPPPSQLAIATSSVNRLLKEEASYHKELEQEQNKVEALKEKIDSGAGDDDGNASFMLKQQVGPQTINHLSRASRLTRDFF